MKSQETIGLEAIEDCEMNQMMMLPLNSPGIQDSSAFSNQEKIRKFPVCIRSKICNVVCLNDGSRFKKMIPTCVARQKWFVCTYPK